jgi:membrane associated rhomboid family serine protease
VLPLKDNIPTDRLPIVTLLLIAANVLGSFFLQHGGILELLATVLFLWVFGISVEDAMSRLRFAAFAVLGSGAATGLLLLIDPGATVEPVAAASATAAVVGGYIRLYPRARVVSATLVPFTVTLIEVPAWGFVGAWFVIQATFAATALGAPATDGAVAFVAQAVAFAFGLLAIRAFAQRRKPTPLPASAIAARS